MVAVSYNRTSPKLQFSAPSLTLNIVEKAQRQNFVMSVSFFLTAQEFHIHEWRVAEGCGVCINKGVFGRPVPREPAFLRQRLEISAFLRPP